MDEKLDHLNIENKRLTQQIADIKTELMIEKMKLTDSLNNPLQITLSDSEQFTSMKASLENMNSKYESVKGTLLHMRMDNLHLNNLNATSNNQLETTNQLLSASQDKVKELTDTLNDLISQLSSQKVNLSYDASGTLRLFNESFELLEKVRDYTSLDIGMLRIIRSHAEILGDSAVVIG